MKLKIILTNQFKKDLKRAKKQSRDLDLLDQIVTKLANQESLPENCILFSSYHTLIQLILLHSPDTSSSSAISCASSVQPLPSALPRICAGFLASLIPLHRSIFY